MHEIINTMSLKERGEKIGSITHTPEYCSTPQLRIMREHVEGSRGLRECTQLFHTNLLFMRIV